MIKRIKEISILTVEKYRFAMEYKVVIQENLCNGSIYVHSFPLEAEYIKEAMRFMKLDYHSDCVFVLEYCPN